MNRDTLALAILTGLALVILGVLAALKAPIPDALAYGASGLVGALTGGAVLRTRKEA